MGGEEGHGALAELATCLELRGITSLGIRLWPSGLVLSVTPNLSVHWSSERFHWHEGREQRSHAGDDADGAAEKLAELYRRLMGPVFQVEARDQR